MTTFQIDSDLEIGSIFEVAGSSIKITLDRDITELSKSYGGSVYSVGQIGSIVKIHLGRRLVFASVGLLRLQSDEEMSAIGSQQAAGYLPSEKRVIEANLIGEGVWDKKEERFSFKRGVSHYPLPLQKTHLVTMEELEILYESADQSLGGELENKVAIGHYVGATRVQCKANIDKLFGQHCAILGSTGSGKSNAVAAVLHSVLEHEPEPGGAINPQIILIDPHGEYASAFEESSAIFHAYDTLGKSDDESSVIKLPYWLMSGDEIRSLIVGKTEVEATSQANTVYKALMHAKMFAMSLVESAFDDIPIDLPDGVLPEEPVRREGVSEEQISSFDRDRPIPFSLDEFVQHIVGRQALILKGKNWAKAAPGEFHKKFGSILNKLRVLRSDPRLHFLMADYKPSDPNLAEIISQLISTEAAEKSRIKIIDISGLRNEIAGPLAGAIARLLFQYKQFQTSSERERDPILLICEEAHRCKAPILCTTFY